MEEAYEQLAELAQQPLDINTAEVSELLLIPGLTMDQISDIIRYREKYGSLRSVSELNMIPSIDDRMLRYITTFLKVYDKDKSLWYSRENLRRHLSHLRHTVLFTASIPTYYRAGDKGATSSSSVGSNKYADTYLGDPTKHTLRYSIAMGQYAKFNLTGGKGAAEPFFSNGNNLGYDSYAFNLSVKRLGIFRNIILGQYRAQFGMGLTLNNSFTLGKQAMLSSVGRLSSTFTPHSSTSDSKHLQGIAATVDIGRLQASAFFSFRYIDATLNADSTTISSILTSGYHRTRNEMRKKNNCSQMTEGIHLRYGNITGAGIDWAVGASFVHTSLDRNINPTYSKADTVSNGNLYRLFYPRGARFRNTSADYLLRWQDLSFTGETALSANGALATVNSLSWRATGSLSLSALQRFYSYDYTSLYGSAFSDGGMVQNESGIYLGMKWNILKHLTLDAYTDFAYFPWLKYRISNTSHSWDNSITATWSLKKWNLALRYRIKQQQKDLSLEDEKGYKLKTLQNSISQHLRFTVSYSDDRWTSRTQLEGCFKQFGDRSNGMMVSQGLQYNISKKFSAYIMAAYFNTDDYDSRLYAYERGMQYSFSYASYYGNGMRLAFLIKADVARWLMLQAKVGHTRYFDRSTIGTAERMIFSNNQTDIDLQVRIKI